MRLTVAVRELTGAGRDGLTMLEGGRTTFIGRKQPELVGMDASVMARTM
jgi:hypothetical protein